MSVINLPMSLFFYQFVCAVGEVSFQYNAFKVTDWSGMLKCLATGSPLLLSQMLFL